MQRQFPVLAVSIGPRSWTAALRRDLAPRACERLEALLPYRGRLIHPRWSGEACWAPLGAAWPAGATLEPEGAIHEPAPGQVLLYAGSASEPELLFPYGPCRFACRAGPLAGQPVLSLDDPGAELAEAGRDILWTGAAELRIQRL
jgi:hypothetical protein